MHAAAQLWSACGVLAAECVVAVVPARHVGELHQ
jgi:hypothetical protein